MAETRYWVCDGCGYKTDEMPQAGAFIRYNRVQTPMMAVAFIDQSGGDDPRETEHVCLDCYEMGMVVSKAGKGVVKE